MGTSGGRSYAEGVGTPLGRFTMEDELIRYQAVLLRLAVLKGA
jgi:hypothetical protein